MSKYLIEFVRWESSAVVEYDQDGILLSLSFNRGNLQPEGVKAFFARTPYKIDHLDSVYRTAPNTRVSVVAEDLSFDAFWQKYDNKFGNKAQAEKMWKALSEADQAAAMRYIDAYDRFLSTSTIKKAYPTTYLNQKRWNN